jgi:hypothetical protein
MDVNRLLAGEGLTKVRKLAVLVDVLGLSHGEIARLLRSTLPPRVSQAVNKVPAEMPEAETRNPPPGVSASP